MVHPLFGATETTFFSFEKWNISSKDARDNFDKHLETIFFVSWRAKSEIEKFVKGPLINLSPINIGFIEQERLAVYL